MEESLSNPLSTFLRQEGHANLARLADDQAEFIQLRHLALPIAFTTLSDSLRNSGTAKLLGELLRSLDIAVASWDAQFNSCIQARDHALADCKTAVAERAAAVAERDLFRKKLDDDSNEPWDSSKDDCIVKDPLPFAAEGKDTREIQTNFLRWRSQIRMRWNLMPRRYKTERKKLAHVMSLLSGTPWKVRQDVQDALAEDRPDDRLPFKTGLALLENLSISYVVHDLAADAKTRIISLTQGDESFATFLADFNTTADQAGWTDEQKIDGLKVRVSHAMQEMHKTNIVDPEKNDWESWARLYMKYASKLEETRALRKYRSQTTPKAQNPQVKHGDGQEYQKQAQQQAADPDRMDLDALRLNRLHPDELQRRIDNDLCKRCGGQGHYARNCDGAGNTVPDRFPAARSRGTNRGRGGSRVGGRGAYPQPYNPQPEYPTPYRAPAQQLRSTDTWFYPALPSFTPPSSTPSPTPNALQPQQQARMLNPGFPQPGLVYDTVGDLSSSQQGAFDNQGKV
jgi:hypothetical protein